MEAEERARYGARARVLKAMAHPARLYMIEVLAGGERCVCELTEMVGSDMSTVSRHLSVLRNASIVRDEKRGSQVFYSLRVPCILNFLSCFETGLATELAEQAEPGNQIQIGSGREAAYPLATRR